MFAFSSFPTEGPSVLVLIRLLAEFFFFINEELAPVLRRVSLITLWREGMGACFILPEYFHVSRVCVCVCVCVCVNMCRVCALSPLLQHREPNQSSLLDSPHDRLLQRSVL